ncbi:MAG: cytochrome b N-terminal domain-containing protein [Gemmatimonadota bacterium]|nr:cytochrome b N-terminal domain-containing protein [Gemmatimonadota bacterium]
MPEARVPESRRADAIGQGPSGLAGRVWRSIVRAPLAPRTDQERKWAMVQNFVLHFRPVRVPVKTLAYTHTLGLGGMSLVLVMVLIGTGVLLMFGYEPAPGRAYDSVQALETVTTFGGFVRGVHHWSANALILIAVLHLLRVFFTSGFHAPRQFNWVIGLGLLACIAASNFTGYLLPWDQRSFWAITITTGMLSYVPLIGGWLQQVARGGPDIGRATLIIFYTLHTTVVPVLILGLAALHFWRIRKARGVVVPRAPGEAHDPQPERVLGLPFLLMREFVVALVLVAGVFTFAALVAAPLGEVANPGMSPNPAKAPWYFMGLQELLLHFHPVFAVLIVPGAAVLLLLAIPYLRYEDDPSGIWFVSNRGRLMARRAAMAALLLTPLLIALDEWVLDASKLLPTLPGFVTVGVLPVTVLTVLAWVTWKRERARPGATRNEMVLAGFVFGGVTFAVLTVVGVWFRVGGMALGWAGW